MLTDEQLSERCVCGHERRRHMAHGRAGEYDPCIAAHGEGGSSVCPCLEFKLAKPEEAGRGKSPA